MNKEDTRINPSDLPPPTRNGRPLVDGEVSEDPLDVCAARYNLTRQRAEEIFQFFDEHMNSGDQMLRGSLAQAKGESFDQALREVTLFFGKSFLILESYTRKQSEYKYVRAAILTKMFVLGFGAMIEVRTFADIARMAGLGKKQNGKQTVFKCAEHFLKQMKLSPLMTQRTAAARAEMQRARQEQLNKNSK
jgi:hypothetical protein